LAEAAAEVQVRAEKNRERNKKRKLQRRAVAAYTAILKEGEKKKEKEKEVVSVAAVVETTVRGKKPQEAKSSKVDRFEKSLIFKLSDEGQFTEGEKKFISELGHLIIAFMKKGEKEKGEELKEEQKEPKRKGKSKRTDTDADVFIAEGAKEGEELKKKAAAAAEAAVTAALKEKELKKEAEVATVAAEEAAILVDVREEVEKLKLEIEIFKKTKKEADATARKTMEAAEFYRFIETAKDFDDVIIAFSQETWPSCMAVGRGIEDRLLWSMKEGMCREIEDLREIRLDHRTDKRGNYRCSNHCHD